MNCVTKWCEMRIINFIKLKTTGDRNRCYRPKSQHYFVQHRVLTEHLFW